MIHIAELIDNFSRILHNKPFEQHDDIPENPNEKIQVISWMNFITSLEYKAHFKALQISLVLFQVSDFVWTMVV